MEMSSRIVAQVLHDLQGRSGFDDWWYEIDLDIQEEIAVDLTAIVEAELDKFSFGPAAVSSDE